MRDSFDLAEVEAGIAGTPFTGQIHHVASTGSTNTLALEAAHQGVECGVWVADEQTAGRGRGGHAWHSRAGDGLYVSVLVRPRLPAGRALWLSLAAGLAAHSAILSATGLTGDVRWPNDLMLAGKKCGGILVETATSAQLDTGGLRYAVIGIGMNVNQTEFPPELSALATSLRQQTGSMFRREPLLSALLSALHRELRELATDDSKLLERFAAVSTWVRGKQVRAGENGGYTGVTAGLNPDGFLLVDGDDGVQHIVLSGGVRAIEAPQR